MVLKFVGAGTHVPIVERKIRTLKEKIRCIIHSLEYKLSSFLLGKLVEYAANRTNLIPSRLFDELVSPSEMFQGDTNNLTSELLLGFGDTVELHNAKDNTHNSVNSRTTPVV